MVCSKDSVNKGVIKELTRLYDRIKRAYLGTDLERQVEAEVLRRIHRPFERLLAHWGPFYKNNTGNTKRTHKNPVSKLIFATYLSTERGLWSC
jgi:hypothetical protein